MPAKGQATTEATAERQNQSVTGKDRTVLTALASEASPVQVEYLARKAWVRKRRLPQKERVVRAALRRLRKAGMVEWELDPQWGCWGWFCTSKGRHEVGY
jgi:hypothetical protein